MCCHEVCRFNAITPKRSVVGSIIHFLVNTWKRLMMAPR
jgi:MinD superfamily P-loop ATPase